LAPPPHALSQSMFQMNKTNKSTPQKNIIKREYIFHVKHRLSPYSIKALSKASKSIHHYHHISSSSTAASAAAEYPQFSCVISSLLAPKNSLLCLPHIYNVYIGTYTYFQSNVIIIMMKNREDQRVNSTPQFWTQIKKENVFCAGLCVSVLCTLTRPRRENCTETCYITILYFYNISLSILLRRQLHQCNITA